MMTRREAIKTTAIAGVALAMSPNVFAQETTKDLVTNAPADSFMLPPLPYEFDALEPHIDARTMEIHHDKHHAAYVTNLNKALAAVADRKRTGIEDVLAKLSDLPESIRTAVRNNGGGHYNHTLFWHMMKKGGGGEPKGEVARAVETSFGNFTDFKAKFADAATKVFGSGWAWLVLDGKQLKIESAPNQDSPVSQGRQPLLGLDVWEHAYYLKYQNKRADYIAAWWNVVDWNFVADRYRKLQG